jgi:hypothetical protein
MPKPRPLELRERVVNAVENRRVAARGDRLVRRKPQFGNQTGATPAGDGKHRSETERGQYLALGSARGLFVCVIARQPDLTLDEIVAARHKRRITGSRSAVWRSFSGTRSASKKRSRSARSALWGCGRARAGRRGAGAAALSRSYLGRHFSLWHRAETLGEF